MEFPTNHPSHWNYLCTYPAIFSYPIITENYFQWTQSPECGIFFVDLLGVRKEEIKVEVEDSKYLIIRTEAMDESTNPARSFMRKFRLPGMINIDGRWCVDRDCSKGFYRAGLLHSSTRCA